MKRAKTGRRSEFQMRGQAIGSRAGTPGAPWAGPLRGVVALGTILFCTSGVFAQTAEVRNGIDDDGDGYIDEFTNGSYFVGLGDLPGGDTFSIATRVSNPRGAEGPVVVGEGRSAAGREAFRWTIAEGIQGLGGTTFVATDISRDGSVIVGHMSGPGGFFGFRWTQLGGVFTLEGPAAPVAAAVSGDGTLAFGGGLAGFGAPAMFWTASGFVQPTLWDTGQNQMVAPSFDGSIAYINSVLCCGNRKQYRWTPASGPVFLGSQQTTPNDIRHGTPDGGTVVGMAGRCEGTACRWSTLSGLLDIGPNASIAHATSADASRIVGQIGTTSSPEAVIFSSATGPFRIIDCGFGFLRPALFCNTGESDAPVRIASVLDGAGLLPAGWRLVSANGVSPDGEYIAGEGINPLGRTEAWLARIVINRPPVGHAGADQTVPEGVVVILDGTGSDDPNQDPLTYQWTQVAGPPVTLLSTTNPTATFVSPLVAPGGATLTFELEVSDAAGPGSLDTVDITVVNINHIAALAGDDQNVAEASPVTLDGSLSYDQDGEPFTYSWVQTGGPSVALNLSDPVRPTFIAPLVGSAGQTLEFQLLVDDGIDTATDNVRVLVENVNHDPVADAGADQTRDEGSVVTLTGVASNDPDADPLSYEWQQVSGPAVTLLDSHGAAPSFVAPAVSLGGATLTFRLCVDDGYNGVDCDQVVVNVRDTNSAPECSLARPSVTQLWPPNHKMVPVTIVGVSDPEDQGIAVTILGVTQDEPTLGLGDGDSGPDAVIQGSTVLLRAERAGSGNGRVYRVTFRADDGHGGVCEGTVRVCVPHSISRNGAPCVEDPPLIDSLIP